MLGLIVTKKGGCHALERKLYREYGVRQCESHSAESLSPQCRGWTIPRSQQLERCVAGGRSEGRGDPHHDRSAGRDHDGVDRNGVRHRVERNAPHQRSASREQRRRATSARTAWHVASPIRLRRCDPHPGEVDQKLLHGGSPAQWRRTAPGPVRHVPWRASRQAGGRCHQAARGGLPPLRPPRRTDQLAARHQRPQRNTSFRRACSFLKQKHPGFPGGFWCAWHDSNVRPLAPQANTLSS
jgi:hypothetical protein